MKGTSRCSNTVLYKVGISMGVEPMSCSLSTSTFDKVPIREVWVRLEGWWSGVHVVQDDLTLGGRFSKLMVVCVCGGYS